MINDICSIKEAKKLKALEIKGVKEDKKLKK